MQGNLDELASERKARLFEMFPDVAARCATDIQFLSSVEDFCYDLSQPLETFGHALTLVQEAPVLVEEPDEEFPLWEEDFYATSEFEGGSFYDGDRDAEETCRLWDYVLEDSLLALQRADISWQEAVTGYYPALENYLRSFHYSADEFFFESIRSLSELQALIDLDIKTIQSCQQHLFMTRWGCEYPRMTIIEASLQDDSFEFDLWGDEELPEVTEIKSVTDLDDTPKPSTGITSDSSDPLLDGLDDDESAAPAATGALWDFLSVPSEPSDDWDELDEEPEVEPEFEDELPDEDDIPPTWGFQEGSISADESSEDDELPPDDEEWNEDDEPPLSDDDEFVTDDDEPLPDDDELLQDDDEPIIEDEEPPPEDDALLPEEDTQTGITLSELVADASVSDEDNPVDDEDEDNPIEEFDEDNPVEDEDEFIEDEDNPVDDEDEFIEDEDNPAEDEDEDNPIEEPEDAFVDEDNPVEEPEDESAEFDEEPEDEQDEGIIFDEELLDGDIEWDELPEDALADDNPPEDDIEWDELPEDEDNDWGDLPEDDENPAEFDDEPDLDDEDAEPEFEDSEEDLPDEDENPAEDEPDVEVEFDEEPPDEDEPSEATSLGDLLEDDFDEPEFDDDDLEELEAIMDDDIEVGSAAAELQREYSPIGAEERGIPSEAIGSCVKAPITKSEATANTILSLYNKLVGAPKLCKRVLINIFSTSEEG